MSLWLFAFGALSFRFSQAQPGQCNHEDGDYPGCGLSKLTHSSSQPIAGKTFMYKYFPVQTPGDECTNDICDCDATSSHAAWNIKQGRVYTTRQISPSGGAPPGNGFGLHLVDVPAHLTTGGLTTEQVEAHFASKLADMSKFDSFMDFNAVFATSGLQKYKDAFKADGVKYLAAVWTGAKGTDYTSIIVQVPGSQLILELCQKGSLTYDAFESRPVTLEQRVPDSTLIAKDAKLSSYNGTSDSSSVGSYIVSLGVNRAVSAKAMAKLEDFYVAGMGTTKTHDATENDVTKKCFLWPGATANLCFTNRPDAATSGDWKVGDFEDMLNTVHSNLLSGHPFCSVDKWFDNHYAIDSQSADTTKILKYVNEKNPFHICSSSSAFAFPPSGGGGLATIFDPTGWGIQLDVQSLGTPNDCNTQDAARLFEGGTFNPACTTDTSKCGSGLPRPLIV